MGQAAGRNRHQRQWRPWRPWPEPQQLELPLAALVARRALEPQEGPEEGPARVTPGGPGAAPRPAAPRGRPWTPRPSLHNSRLKGGCFLSMGRPGHTSRAAPLLHKHRFFIGLEFSFPGIGVISHAPPGHDDTRGQFSAGAAPPRASKALAEAGAEPGEHEHESAGFSKIPRTRPR